MGGNKIKEARSVDRVVAVTSSRYSTVAHVSYDASSFLAAFLRCDQRRLSAC